MRQATALQTEERPYGDRLGKGLGLAFTVIKRPAGTKLAGVTRPPATAEVETTDGGPKHGPTDGRTRHGTWRT